MSCKSGPGVDSTQPDLFSPYTTGRLNVAKKKKKRQAASVLRSMKVFLLRPFPPTFVVNLPNISYLAVGGRRQRDEDDMALLLDNDALQTETEELTYQGKEIEKEGRKNRSRLVKAMRVSKGYVWKNVIDYFCPSYVLARDIENYIPESLLYDRDGEPLAYDGDGGNSMFIYNRENDMLFRHAEDDSGIFRYNGNGAESSQVAGPSARFTDDLESQMFPRHSLVRCNSVFSIESTGSASSTRPLICGSPIPTRGASKLSKNLVSTRGKERVSNAFLRFSTTTESTLQSKRESLLLDERKRMNSLITNSMDQTSHICNKNSENANDDDDVPEKEHMVSARLPIANPSPDQRNLAHGKTTDSMKESLIVGEKNSSKAKREPFWYDIDLNADNDDFSSIDRSECAKKKGEGRCEDAAGFTNFDNLGFSED